MLSVFHRLNAGEAVFDFIGHRKRWYWVSAVAAAALRRQLHLPRVQLRHRVRRRHPVPVQGHDRAAGGGAAGRRAGRGGRAEHPAGGRRRQHPLDRGQGRRADRRPSRQGQERAADPLRPAGQRRGGQLVLGQRHHQGGDPRPGVLPDRGLHIHRDQVRVEDGGRRDRGVVPRPVAHRRHLFDRRLRGQPVHDRRPADHPRFLPVRHGRRVRQGRRERARHPRRLPHHVLGGGQPRRQPDADALDQHLADRAAAGGRAAVRRRRPARRRHDQGPGAGAVRRPGLGGLLVDLPGHPDRLRAQGAGAEVQGAGQAGRAAAGRRGQGRGAGRHHPPAEGGRPHRRGGGHGDRDQGPPRAYRGGRRGRGSARHRGRAAAEAEDFVDEPAEAPEAPAPAGRGAAGAGSSTPRPGARPQKRPAQKRGGGGRPSAKKRR